MNPSGKIIKSFNSSQGLVPINLSYLEQGIYFIHVHTRESDTIQRVVRVK